MSEKRNWIDFRQFRESACRPWFEGVPAALTEQQMDAVEEVLGNDGTPGRPGAWATRQEWIDACKRAKQRHPGPSITAQEWGEACRRNMAPLHMREGWGPGA